MPEPSTPVALAADPPPLERIVACLERALRTSPADETELVWLQRRRGETDSTGRSRLEPTLTSVFVRVVEGGRLGWFRSERLDGNELESGVRQALALAKVQPQMKKRSVLPRDGGPIGPSATPLCDPALERLDEDSARERLSRLCPNGARARLRWTVSRLVIVNSHGLQRGAAATAASLDVAVGDRAGSGRAAGAARALDDLPVDAIRARAHARRVEPGAVTGKLPASGTIPVLLSPEATVELLDVINGHAFSARAYLEGISFLTRHRNIQVFDRLINLRDDGTAGGGLAFPFDFEGVAKRPLDLIVEGKPSTPALGRHQGMLAGLEPTAQAVGGEDAFFGNLFLLPGTAAADDLLAAADGGIHISWLDPPECFDPRHLHVRARARGVRRVADGKLTAPLPDLIWEDSLLRLLARLLAVGRERVARVTPTTPLGAISAPAIVLAAVDVEALRPLPPRRPDHR